MKMLNYLARTASRAFSQPRQAVRAGQLRRLRHRRRHHVLSRREQVQSRRRAPALEWVQFHASERQVRLKAELDQRTALRTDGKRKVWRYQVQARTR